MSALPAAEEAAAASAESATTITATAQPQAGQSPEPKKVRRMKIKWDEATIAEHDKLRGTRMKIDEPDTPFNADYVPSPASGADGGGGGGIEEEVEGSGTLSGALADVPVPGEHDAGGIPRAVAEAQQRQLNMSLGAHVGELEATLREHPKSRWETSDGGDPDGGDDIDEKRRKAKAFAAKRAQHYNMGEKMRLARLAIQKEMEEEEAAERAAEESAAAAAAAKPSEP